MAATAAQVSKLRRMVAEPEAGSTYSNSDLEDYIEARALVDARGINPTRESATTPGSLEANPFWTPTYDLNAAAADIWLEKAAALQPLYTFTADGGSYDRSQAYDNAVRMANLYKGRSSVTTATAKMEPNTRLQPINIGNLPEIDIEGEDGWDVY